jgi:hypothetical protein
MFLLLPTSLLKKEFQAEKNHDDHPLEDLIKYDYKSQIK